MKCVVTDTGDCIILLVSLNASSIRCSNETRNTYLEFPLDFLSASTHNFDTWKCAILLVFCLFSTKRTFSGLDVFQTKLVAFQAGHKSQSDEYSISNVCFNTNFLFLFFIISKFYHFRRLVFMVEWIATAMPQSPHFFRHRYLLCPFWFDLFCSLMTMKYERLYIVLWAWFNRSVSVNMRFFWSTLCDQERFHQNTQPKWKMNSVSQQEIQRDFEYFFGTHSLFCICARSLLLYVMREKIHIVCFLKPLENWFRRILLKKNGSSLDARKCIGIFLDSVLSRIKNFNEFFMWKRLKYFSLSFSASTIQRILSHFPTPLYYISWMWNINGRFC